MKSLHLDPALGFWTPNSGSWGFALRVGGCAAVAAFGKFAPQLVVELNALQGSIDNGFQFACVFHFAALSQAAASFFRTEPSGMTQHFIRTARLVDFHQKSFNHEFLHSAGLPEDSFGM